MLGLVRALPDDGDAVVSVLKSEGSLLDTRLLNGIAADNDAIRELRVQLDRDRARLKASLEIELASLNQISSVHILKLKDRDPTLGVSVTPKTVVESVAMLPPEKIVDFWRNKQDSSQNELASVEAQLASVRSKIEDVKALSNGLADGHESAKLMCMIGTLRQKLQSARSRTRDYQKLLSSVEGVQLPRTSHATGALAERSTNAVYSGHRQCEFDREVLSLCAVETSMVSELEAARRLGGLVQRRKELIDGKHSYFSNMMEVGDFSLPAPPPPAEWPQAVFSEPSVPEAEYMAVIGHEQALELQRTTVVRERRVSMLREMGPSTMDKWIEKQRLARLCEHTERAVNVAELEKASLLSRIDEVAAHAKVHSVFCVT